MPDSGSPAGMTQLLRYTLRVLRYTVPMSTLAQRRHHIYKKRWHIFFAFSLILLPILFFAGFSHFAHIAIQTLFANIGISLARIALAYLISVVLGWSLAVLLYRGRASTVALPFFDVMQSLPTPALLPMAILYWGKTDFTVVFFLVLAIMWPIFFSVMSSLKLIKSEYAEAIIIYNVTGWKKIRYFLWPASIPGLITGSIVGLGNGWEALVATEIIVGIGFGLGSFFQKFSTNGEITVFGILGILMIIFTINKMVWLPLLERSHSLSED